MHDHIKSEELHLEGLHCADCAGTIEGTIAKVGGVKSVKVGFTTGRMKIDYDPHKVTLQDLVMRVEKIGYKVKQEAHKKFEKRNFWSEGQVQGMIISGAALAAGLALRVLTADQPLFHLVGRGVALSVLCFLLATFAGAFNFARAGWASIRRLRFTMDALMTMAIVGAIIIAEYIEAASLAFLFSLAELLESFAVERARNSLRALMKLTPETACVKHGESEIALPVAQVEIGDLLIIRPGEKVPLDGEVVSGYSSLDQSPITGESVPVSKEVGETVFAGSINVEGYLEVRVSKRSENSMLARIIHMVEEAESQKAPSERFVERFSRIYTPTVVALAVVVAIVPPLFLGGAFNAWFVKALTLLVIACPCALVISTPVSVVSALTNASRNGVLIKGGVYLEEMSRIKVIAFDKTGTLTKGQLKVTDVVSLNGMPEIEVLRLAASLESRSSHPIARAIVDAADGTPLQAIAGFESLPGKGIRGTVNGEQYHIGRPELFSRSGLNLPSQELQSLQQAGKTTMLVGSEKAIVGIIALQDEIRGDAREMVRQLQAAGKEVVMITGDNPETAKAIASELGICHYHAALLPEDKVKEIKLLEKKHGKVAMVGDGVNDAPALAAATVGVAMGVAGTDTALETAHIALMSDDLSKLPYLIELSRRAQRVIKQNIWASIVIKFTLAIGVFPGLVSLVMAVVIGDMGASLGVTSNAMRLARFRAKDENRGAETEERKT
ncbi:MAG TPA: cation-translocating P-type ATPase [bacterium]